MELTFDRFDLDVGSSEGCDEYVQVYDGRSEESMAIDGGCGSTISAPVKSSGRYMRVRYLADREFNKPHRGFKATFKAVNKYSKLELFKLRCLYHIALKTSTFKELCYGF